MNYCRTHTDDTQCGCNANYRRVMQMPIPKPGETVSLGVESALPPSFTQDPPKASIDWEAVCVWGTAAAAFVAVLILSSVKP